MLEAAVYDGSQQLGLEDEVTEIGGVDTDIVAPKIVCYVCVFKDMWEGVSLSKAREVTEGSPAGKQRAKSVQ
jgi:hypothetical protein